MKWKRLITGFGIFASHHDVKVPNFVIKEVSQNKKITHYMATRHDGLQVSMICFKDGDQVVYESIIKINGNNDNYSQRYHASLGDMFEYAVKVGNEEISPYQ